MACYSADETVDSMAVLKAVPLAGYLEHLKAEQMAVYWVVYLVVTMADLSDD